MGFFGTWSTSACVWAPGERLREEHALNTIAKRLHMDEIFYQEKGSTGEGHVEPAKTEGQLRKNAVPFVDTVGELKKCSEFESTGSAVEASV